MAYTAFDPAKPDATVDDGTDFATNTRNNLKAIRDAVIMGGGFYGWNMDPDGGTAAEPATITYSNGVERVKASLTWTSGNVTNVVYHYSSNSGGAYDQIGEVDITFDGSGNVTATEWS